jgi:hypothetical protein
VGGSQPSTLINCLAQRIVAPPRPQMIYIGARLSAARQESRPKGKLMFEGFVVSMPPSQFYIKKFSGLCQINNWRHESNRPTNKGVR